MSVEVLTTFFGWCTVINMGLLIVSSLALVLARPVVSKIHAKMFSMDESALPPAYFQYLAQMKIITLTLNLAPYVALKLMAS